MDGILLAWQESLGVITDDDAKRIFFDMFEGTSCFDEALQILAETLPTAAEEVRREIAAQGR
ncbi:MAG: hypothetical protein AAB634_01580 [Patescibacteria group bacterium]